MLGFKQQSHQASSPRPVSPSPDTQPYRSSLYSGLPSFALPSTSIAPAESSSQSQSFDVSWLASAAPSTYPYTWPSASGALTTNTRTLNVEKPREQRKPRATSANSAKSSRSYRNWDRRREKDGLTEEGCLVQWMAERDPPNWRDWKNAKRRDQKEKMIARLNEYFRNAGFQERSKESFNNKLKLIEKSFKKALRWVYSTGSGVYSQTIEPGDTRSPYQRELDKICPYFDQLFDPLQKRVAMIPPRIWSTVDEEGNRQSDQLLRQLLGLEPLEIENTSDQSHSGGEDTDDDTPTAAKPYSGQGSMPVVPSDREGRGTKRRRGTLGDDDLIEYLGQRVKTEDRRLRLEERRWKAERLKVRAETIATYMKGGMSKEEALATYKESKDEASSSEEPAVTGT